MHLAERRDISSARGGWVSIRTRLTRILATVTTAALATLAGQATWGQHHRAAVPGRDSPVAAVGTEVALQVEPPPVGQRLQGPTQLPFPMQFVPADSLDTELSTAPIRDSVEIPAGTASKAVALTRRRRGETARTGPDRVRFRPSPVTALSSLFIVLGVFFAMAWLMRRTGQTGSGSPPSEVLRHLGYFSLGHRRRVELVRFGGKLLILSTTQHGVEKIAELDDPEEVAQLTASCLAGRRRSHALVRELIASTQAPSSVTDSSGRSRYSAAHDVPAEQP